MAIYSRRKFEEEVAARRKFSYSAAKMPIHEIQEAALKLALEPPPPGVTQLVYEAAGQSQAADALFTAIEGLKQSAVDYNKPETVDVPVERVVPSKSDVTPESPVLIFVHGGGFIFGSPATARRNARKLADLTGGVCIVPRYRKSPADPFPAALLDLFCVYLSLLSPHDDSKATKGVSPRKLIFAGESSGFNALLALLQVILNLRGQGVRSVLFHGREVTLELPVAVAGICGFLDVTGSLPSWSRNAPHDVMNELQPTYTTKWREEPLWPSDPPRADCYCERSAMTHPLVSTVRATSWVGAPPLFLAAGDEMMLDSNLFVAQLAAAQGIPVRFMHYEALNHVWPTSLPKLPHSTHVLKAWAAFIRNCAEGKPIETSACHIAFDDFKETPMDISNLTTLTRDDIERMTDKGQRERLLVRRKENAKI